MTLRRPLRLAAVLAAVLTAMVATPEPASARTRRDPPPVPAADPAPNRPPEVKPGKRQAARPDVRERTFMIEKGVSVAKHLTDHGVPAKDVPALIDALATVLPPRRLQPGQQVRLAFERQGRDEERLVVEIETAPLHVIRLEPDGEDGFTARDISREPAPRLAAAAAVIHSSLYASAARAGVPVAVIYKLIKLYSYDIDFQRDLHPGDRFEVLYETPRARDGRPAGSGEIVQASITTGGSERRIYRFHLRDGGQDYFNAAGESIRKALLRTPVDGARLSSGFGMRLHPILGYSRMHRGADFAAPDGTPVFAAGDGVVVEAGPKGAYGNYVQIRHNTEIATAYAHLSRFAPRLERGDRVSQGQVIGAVGSTGRSTGPHLHFEVLRDGEQINPLAFDLPTGNRLAGRDLAAFRKEVAEIDHTVESLTGRPAKGSLQLAQLPASKPRHSGSGAACGDDGC